MIKVKGNLIDETKVLQVRPYTVKKEVGWYCEVVHIGHLEITYENGIVSNIQARLEDYEKALKESD